MGLAACSGAGQPQTPAPDPALEQAALDGTALDASYTAAFAWSLREADARFTGEGSARVGIPEHARLDLFGPRGEFFLAAALVGDELRLPPGVTSVPLPPPELFWGVLGVLRRPPDAALTESYHEDDATTRLVYRRGEERWVYEVAGGSVVQAEWTDDEGGRMTVEVRSLGADGRPSSVRYRDWPAFVELTIDVTDIQDVEGHPDETWDPAL